MNDDPRLVDERVLRRALRLDADERGPRLDAASLRLAAAREAATPAWLAVVGAFAFAVIALAGVATTLRVATDLAALALDGQALADAVGLIASVAEPLDGLLAFATQPAIPIAIVTGLFIAALAERRLSTEDTNA